MGVVAYVGYLRTALAKRISKVAAFKVKFVAPQDGQLTEVQTRSFD